MPGFVMHLVEGKQILRQLEEKMPLTEDWRHRFMTGTLLPDTKLLKEKRFSHFWNPKDYPLLAKAPDLDLFREKYGGRLEDPIVLGYLAHLHLDRYYLRHFWPRFMVFYGAEGEEEAVSEKITQVKILRTGACVPVEDFFSERHYYREYSLLNGYFIDKYRVEMPDWHRIKENPVEEVHLEDMAMISEGLARLVRQCRKEDADKVEIFDLAAIEEMLSECACLFMAEYPVIDKEN